MGIATPVTVARCMMWGWPFSRQSSATPATDAREKEEVAAMMGGGVAMGGA